jgi:hypothetical protein
MFFCLKLWSLISANNDKLHKASSICLISDIRTNKPMYDFMGLAASITNEAFDKEVDVIGMKLMEEIIVLKIFKPLFKLW